MYGRPPRKVKITAQPPAGTQAIHASPEVVEALRTRRKPRKRDVFAAVIAITIVLAMVLSAVLPFFVF